MCAHQRVRAHTHTLHSRPSDTEETRLGKGGEADSQRETRLSQLMGGVCQGEEEAFEKLSFPSNVGVHTGVQTLLVA